MNSGIGLIIPTRKPNSKRIDGLSPVRKIVVDENRLISHLFAMLTEVSLQFVLRKFKFGWSSQLSLTP